MHLDEEQIQRLLHGELTPANATSAREHLAACFDCSSRLAAAEREESWVLDKLRRLDRPPPRVEAAAVMTGRRRHPVTWNRWAAGVVLALALAGAAYALPGSPLRRLVHQIAALMGEAPRTDTRTPREPTDTAARGIGVTPGDRFTIVFSTEQPGGVAVVSLTDRADIAVRAIGGAATFTSDVDRLSIDNVGSSARFQIEIPRRAPFVEIRVGRHRVFSKEGLRVITGARRDSDDRYLVPLAQPR
jgi:hypothetical protein